MAVKQPHKSASGAIEGFKRGRKGERATAARNIREEVAAEAGRESFIRAPRGKLVPYNTEEKNRVRRALAMGEERGDVGEASVVVISSSPSCSEDRGAEEGGEGEQGCVCVSGVDFFCRSEAL